MGSRGIQAEGAWRRSEGGATSEENRAVRLVEDEPGGLTGHVLSWESGLFLEQWEAVGPLQAGS